MEPMLIRQNSTLGFLMLAPGALCLALGLITVHPVSIGIGSLVVVMGMLFLKNPGAVVHEDEIEIRNVWGMTLRCVPFASRDALFVRDGFLWVENDHGLHKVLGGFAVDPDDMQRLEQWIAAPGPTG
jgi:hypothetical protein